MANYFYFFDVQQRPQMSSAQQAIMALILSTRKPYCSSMLRRGLRLNCLKSYIDHNFVKIYQNLPKFGNLGKIGNLTFPAT